MSENGHSGLRLDEHAEASNPTKMAFNSGSTLYSYNSERQRSNDVRRDLMWRR